MPQQVSRTLVKIGQAGWLVHTFDDAVHASISQLRSRGGGLAIRGRSTVATGGEDETAGSAGLKP